MFTNFLLIAKTLSIFRLSEYYIMGFGDSNSGGSGGFGGGGGNIN